MWSVVYPMNILMIGPTGTGKTELSRRLAKLIDGEWILYGACQTSDFRQLRPSPLIFSVAFWEIKCMFAGHRVKERKNLHLDVGPGRGQGGHFIP